MVKGRTHIRERSLYGPRGILQAALVATQSFLLGIRIITGIYPFYPMSCMLEKERQGAAKRRKKMKEKKETKKGENVRRGSVFGSLNSPRLPLLSCWLGSRRF